MVILVQHIQKMVKTNNVVKYNIGMTRLLKSEIFYFKYFNVTRCYIWHFCGHCFSFTSSNQSDLNRRLCIFLAMLQHDRSYSDTRVVGLLQTASISSYRGWRCDWKWSRKILIPEGLKARKFLYRFLSKNRCQKSLEMFFAFSSVCCWWSV